MDPGAGGGQGPPMELISDVTLGQGYRLPEFEKRVGVPTLDEKVRTIVLEIEKSPLKLLSKDLLEELGDYVKDYHPEVEGIRNALSLFLDKFAEKKFGVPMGEKTKKFLLNELIYLVLKLKSDFL